MGMLSDAQAAKKGNVTIYLPLDVLARCRAVAEEENRSLSNYLSGLLERAHPPTSSFSGKLDGILESARSFERKAVRRSSKAVGVAKRK
jgi:hypothetical protein